MFSAFPSYYTGSLVANLFLWAMARLKSPTFTPTSQQHIGHHFDGSLAQLFACFIRCKERHKLWYYENQSQPLSTLDYRPP
jgi:hypothetical protein